MDGSRLADALRDRRAHFDIAMATGAKPETYLIFRASRDALSAALDIVERTGINDANLPFNN